jgi:hypothetical protein
MTRRSELFRPPSIFTIALSSTLLLCFAVSCDQGNEAPAPEAMSEPLEIAGRYELSGETTTPGSDQSRKISGIMMIKQAGDLYTANFEFKTNFPGEGAPVDADVIGVGEGQVKGMHLMGTAQTQIVISAVPGVDTGFAFIPRVVSTRIVSTSIGEFGPGGTLSLQIESHAAEGEKYESTRTKMHGVRIDDGASSSGKTGNPEK